ncbi:MAG: hypothetical protein Q9224_004570 [Gallowayella concinna]
MIPWRFLPPFAFLLAQADVSHQVDIRIERTFHINGEPESFFAATCMDILPGACCKPPNNYPDATTKVLFRHLRVRDIAAVWRDDYSRNHQGATRRTLGCSGPLLASSPGPGSWLWRQPANDRRAAEGASYISLPRTLPPDPKTASWLEWEGLLGLVWSGGNGRWFANAAAETLHSSDNDILVGAKYRRDMRSSMKGSVYARRPLSVRYPTSIDINGTRYLDTQRAQFSYTDSDGNVLNLTHWFVDDGS